MLRCLNGRDCEFVRPEMFDRPGCRRHGASCGEGAGRGGLRPMPPACAGAGFLRLAAGLSWAPEVHSPVARDGSGDER